MEETDNIQPKLPNQEIDYFKIGKILLSRWFWIAGAVAVCSINANVFLWYTPKTFSTFGTMKFEEKKSEISDLITVSSNPDRVTSKIQSETVVLESTPLLINAIKHLDYRFSFYIKGRFISRINDLYPEKPLHIDLITFDTLNFFHDMVTFRPVNKTEFSLSYMSLGKEIQKLLDYNAPFSIGPTTFRIKYSGDIPKTTAILFKLNTPEDFVGRVRVRARHG